jgi:hypothetical protein
MHEVRLDSSFNRVRSGTVSCSIAPKAAGFEVLVTTDQNLRYQQNLARRGITIIVISTTSWPRIQKHVDSVAKAIAGAASGACVEVPIP